MKTIIIGAGNWGTTLSILCSHGGSVSLWTRTAAHAEKINRENENETYLKSILLPGNVKACVFGAETIEDDDMIIVAVPSYSLRSVAKQLRPLVYRHTVVSATKGFEHQSFKTMSEVLEEELRHASIAVLSGPNIAREIAEGKPAKAVLASRHFAAIAKVMKTIPKTLMSFEINHDMRSVELCAALKGIVAIGAGIAEGTGLGPNAVGVLMTYGLHEFTSIARFLNIPSITVYGIAGLGDLIATSMSPDSRNKRFGRLIAGGLERDAALREVGMVVEGVQMARTITHMKNCTLQIPLFSAIADCIFDDTCDVYSRIVNCITDYNNAGIAAKQAIV